jgi:hypothetical protein
LQHYNLHDTHYAQGKFKTWMVNPWLTNICPLVLSMFRIVDDAVDHRKAAAVAHSFDLL